MSLYQQLSKTQQSSHKSSHKYLGLNEKNMKSYSIRPIQLQVNISIGKNKYLLQVQKCSNLHEQVQQFLKNHGISLKYQGPILSMVRQQLTKKQILKHNKHKQKEQQKAQINQLKQVKSQIDNKKKILSQIQKREQQQQKQQIQELWSQIDNPKVKKVNLINLTNKQNKQNYPSQYNSNSKHGSSTEAPGQSNIHQIVKQPKQIKQQELKCQNVYQKWKVKQKIKENQKAKNVSGHTKINRKQKLSNASFLKQKQETKPRQQDKSKSISQKKLQVHSPDYLYNKGKKFQEVRQGYIQQLYKQKYPFQINKQASITPSKKRQLHDRLYKQHRSRQEARMDKKIKEQMAQKPKHFVLPTDKYKQKVIQRDHKIDEALSYLLENKMIENPYKIQKVSKSPFRKTNF